MQMQNERRRVAALVIMAFLIEPCRRNYRNSLALRAVASSRNRKFNSGFIKFALDHALEDAVGLRAA